MHTLSRREFITGTLALAVPFILPLQARSQSAATGIETFKAALAKAADPSLRPQALEEAATIAATLGGEAREDKAFFNGENLDHWQGTMEYWRVEDGVIVGSSDDQIPRNEFLWYEKPVTDFYLALDVQLTPVSGNAGIQFRSKKVDEHGQAHGYQADVGEGWWGKLYHEHGRKLLDDNENGNTAVKPGDWNRYEILAVGPAIWTAINGNLCTALLDLEGEASGQIALQIHSGPPETVGYRIHKLIHNPKIEIANLSAKDLLPKLR